MKKFVCFVAVGLAITVLQVATVEADVDISHCADLPPTTRPQCEADAHSGMQGDHSGMHGDHSGMHGDHSGMQGNHSGIP